MSERRVKIADLRPEGYCLVGIKRFAVQYGLEFKQLVKDGWAQADLEATGDGLAQRVLTKVRAEHG